MKQAFKVRRLCARFSGNRREENAMALLSFQAKAANVVWTRQEYTNLCDHLHNENAPTHFVMGFRKKDGSKNYVRSKTLPVERAISWGWSSIIGTAKRKLAFVPYSTNDRQQSRWGGMDFDAHDGTTDRARELAFAAFRCLLNYPEFSVILEMSGSGGWHVWAISAEFHDTQDWVRLLKSVASTIGATIAAGICEIFPPDSQPSRFGKGIRAPGCWNPATDTCSEIVWENTHSSLGIVLSGNRKTKPLYSNGFQIEFPDTKKETSFSSSSLYHGDDLLRRFGITLPNTRNNKLSELVGTVFHQVGYSMARKLAQEQFRRKVVATNADETEHLKSFDALWQGRETAWEEELSPKERDAFARLATQNEQDAFRIIRSYAQKAQQDGAEDFPIARDNLAARLGITGNGAAKIRDKLASQGAIERTAEYRPNKSAARYRWLLPN